MSRRPLKSLAMAVSVLTMAHSAIAPAMNSDGLIRVINMSANSGISSLPPGCKRVIIDGLTTRDLSQDISHEKNGDTSLVLGG